MTTPPSTFPLPATSTGCYKRAMVRARLAILGALCIAACASSDAEHVGESMQALETYPNEQPAFDYFLAKGLTPAQSAGIVGNLDVESGVDPAIEQKGGPGRGIAQWSAGGRWDTTKGDNVKDFASEHQQSATSLGLQLDFIWFELTTFEAYGLAQLQAATTANDAVLAFSKYYEGCGSCANSTRVAHAEDVLARFGGDAPDASASSSSGGNVPACTVQGTAGTCISTSACAAMSSHVSTPGLCPGADDIQCCTATDGSGPSSNGARDDGSDSGGCSTAGSAANAWWLVLIAIALLRGSGRCRSAACESA